MRDRKNLYRHYRKYRTGYKYAPNVWMNVERYEAIVVQNASFKKINTSFYGLIENTQITLWECDATATERKQ